VYKNNEGYYDPTAGTACKHIRSHEKIKRKKESGKFYMKWIYIASPYKGDIELNTIRARRYSRFVASQNCVPICPHIFLTQFLRDDYKNEREVGLHLGSQMLKRCNELWVFGFKISEGMQKEIDFAKKNKIHIKYFDINCEELKK